MVKRSALVATLLTWLVSGCSNEPPPAVESKMVEPQQLSLLRKPAPKGAKVYFISPDDGAQVTNPITVKFGLWGMGVAPAGIDQPDTGHHHLLIDRSLQNFAVPIPKDDQHLHFGGGETETVVSLSPGQHTLQLYLGDYLHIPHEPPLISERITITVTE